MTKFDLARTPVGARRASPRALALWPFVLAIACNTYDDSLKNAAALGGGGGAGEAESGSSGASAMAGKSNGGTGAEPSAGSDPGGSAGSGASSAGMGGAGASAGTGGAGGGDGGATSMGGSAAGDAGKGGGGSGGTSGETLEVVDDMEDGDAEITIANPRNGFWYVGNDNTAGGVSDPKSGSFSMTALAASDRSDFAAHLKATGFTTWGSVMGFNFIEQAGTVKPYDASAYCGVSFWAKAAATTSVRFRLPDVDTDPRGGVCDPNGGAGTACYDHFGMSVGVSTSWKQFKVKFSDVNQAGTGYHPADGKLKVSKVLASEWALPAGAGTYEVWIDDVALIKCP